MSRLLSTATALALTLGAAVALPPPATAAATMTATSGEAFAAGLREALSSGEFEQVKPFFHSSRDPLLAYLAERYKAWMKDELAVEAWEVTFEPYADGPRRVMGQLSVAARTQDGKRVARRFDVHLVRRGSRLLVGEAIAYDRQDSRLTRHDMVVDLRGGPGEVAVEDRLTLMPDGPDRAVYLMLAPAMRVASVQAGDTPMPFKQLREVLYLERPAGPGPHAVTIRYRGQLPDNGFDFVRNEGTMLRSDYAWYARMPFANPFAVFSLRALVRPGQRAVAVGSLDGVDRFSDHWAFQWTTSRAVEGMTLYAGGYRLLEGQSGPVRLEAYTLADRHGIAPALLDESARVLAFFGEHLGAYPYRKLAVVETAFPGGYGASSAVALPREAFDRPALADEFLAHEIAHNWTDLVSYDGPLGVQGFMAEGMASYLDMLYRARRDGPQGLRRSLQAAQRRVWGLAASEHDAPVSSATQDGNRAIWQVLTYDKGAIVLHMLRNQIGDEAFWAAVRSLYGEHEGQRVGLEEFRRAFEEASDSHLGGYFDQWLDRPGVPVIEPEALTVTAVSGGQYRVSGTLRQQTYPYFLTLPVVVVSDTQKTIYQVPVKGFTNDFQLLVEGKPRFLLVDPLGDTLTAPVEPVALQ